MQIFTQLVIVFLGIQRFQENTLMEDKTIIAILKYFSFPKNKVLRNLKLKWNEIWFISRLNFEPFTGVVVRVTLPSTTSTSCRLTHATSSRRQHGQWQRVSQRVRPQSQRNHLMVSSQLWLEQNLIWNFNEFFISVSLVWINKQLYNSITQICYLMVT